MTALQRRTDPDVQAPGMADAVDPDLAVSATDPTAPDRLERTGRRWLLWSFVFCPCHLPLTMAVLATVFGGTAFGALVERNTLGVGMVVGTLYAIGVGIGFRYIKQATAGRNCADGSCELPA